MAQGKAWDKDEVINLLKPFYKLGCSTTKACQYAGIKRATVQTWINEDEELHLKVNAWQNEANAMARENWVAKIKSGDYDASKSWMSVKEKDEFAVREERTGAYGEPITVKVVNYTPNGNNAAAQFSTT